MQRNTQEQVNYWFRYLCELEKISAVFDLNNLLKVHGRILVGFTKEEMIKEAIFSLDEFEKWGYLKIVTQKDNIEKMHEGNFTFDNIVFKFTKKFQKIKQKRLRRQKFEKFKNKSEFWFIVVAVVVSIISLVMQLFK